MLPRHQTHDSVQVGDNAASITPNYPNMPGDNIFQTRRYALKIALIYLLIRGIPDLLLVVVSSLPLETVKFLTETHGEWLRHIYPVVPLQLLSVPFGFQQALALLPVLVIEVVLVFLFSAGFLRRRPWAATSRNASRWIIFIFATLIWSWAIRHQVLAYLQSFSIDELRALQNEADWIDKLPPLLRKASWTLTAVLYATTILWAWLPSWLHFRFAKKPTDLVSNANTEDVANRRGTIDIAIPLQRATVFASFLLGCLVLHFALVQIVYIGLWPWAAESLRINVPMDQLNALDLPLSFSVIVLSGLACALAAHVYVRRFKINSASTRQLIINPLWAGIAAYLLTCFLFLAVAWFAIWLNPALVDSLPRQLSRTPKDGIAFAIALNIGSLVLLCLMSGRLRASPRRWSAVLGVLVLCAALPVYVGGTLASSNLGIAGGKPGFAVTGKLGDARWRNMQQWCTGIVETRHGTWLVGRDDDARGSISYVPDGVPDLSKLVTRDTESNDRRSFGLFGSRPVLTTLALLQDDGKFKVMATVPDVACMVVSPDAETLFLFTGVDRPRSPESPDRGQTAIFRSTDHGMNWEWIERGFMSEVDPLAWNVKPVFSTDQDVWAWGKEPLGEDAPPSIWGRHDPVPIRRAADGTELKPTALFYSSDQGATSSVVYSPEPLFVPISGLREITGEPGADFSSRRDMDKERFLVQVDDTRAYAWASEFMWYRVGKESHRLRITTRAELSRSDAQSEWQITRVIRQPHVRVQHLSTSSDGRTYAVLQDKDGRWLGKLDTQNGEWIERQRTPALLPGWLAEDRTSTRYFWSNGDYQVVSQWGDTVVPRWLIPFTEEPAEIDTDAHFYTRDGGRSWHQLAIPGYLGVMGLSPRGSKVYWNKGNWYSNDEPLQWQYDLAK